MTDILPPAGWPNVRQLETNEFATGGTNGNMNEQAKSLAARSELLKQYAALPYESKTGGYALNERVQLATGDIVRSTIASNVNNPNENMTGWEVPSLNPAENLSDVPDKAAARSNLSVYSQAQVDTAISNATPTIPNATTTDKGIVQLNNTLTSTSTTEALSANMGRELKNYSDQVLYDSRTRATTEIEGRVQIATEAEVLAGTNNTKAVTPKGVKSALSAAGTGSGTLPDATETVAGKAKIATTAIAQAGVNDTDFLTAKKLRDALNATGGAPISACRAWVCFDSTTGGTIIRASNNIQSIVRTSQGKFVITFINEMPHSDYIVLTGTRSDASENSATLNLVVNEASIKPTQNAKTTKTLSVLLGNSVGLLDSYGMSLGVFC